MNNASDLLVDSLFPLLLAPFPKEKRKPGSANSHRDTSLWAARLNATHAEPYSNMLTREIVLIGSFRGWYNRGERQLKDLFFYSPQLGLKATPPPPQHQFFIWVFSCGIF